jgi:hypothetical protein
MEKDPIKRIKHHTFYGHRYKFRYVDPEAVVPKEELEEVRQRCGIKPGELVVGLTDDNRTPNPEMLVSDQLEEENPKELLRVLLDEAFHALDSTTDNDVVDEYARDLSNFLWRCGYRRITSSS